MGDSPQDPSFEGDHPSIGVNPSFEGFAAESPGSVSLVWGRACFLPRSGDARNAGTSPITGVTRNRVSGNARESPLDRGAPPGNVLQNLTSPRRLCYKESVQVDPNMQLPREMWRFLIVLQGKCSRCPATADLVAHHRDEDKENNCLANGECLCRSCHAREHRTNTPLAAQSNNGGNPIVTFRLDRKIVANLERRGQSPGLLAKRLVTEWVAKR